MGRTRTGERPVLLIPFAPGIGDVVMTEPILRSLRANRPEWHLTMAARTYAADLLSLSSCRLITPFYFVSEAPGPLRPLRRLVRQRHVAKLIGPAIVLNYGPFDHVINLFWAWETKVPFDRWWTPQWPMRQGVRHGVDVLVEEVEEVLGLAIPAESRTPRLKPFPEAVIWCRQYLRDQGLGESPLASMIVSSDSPLKWWDPAKWARLNEWLRQMGWRTVLIAPSEHQHAREVHDSCEHKPLWPALALRQVAALLACSDLVVGIDTGPLHMASALGVPWVGLFGPSNPDLIGPYDRIRGRSIVAPIPKPASCGECWLSFKGFGGRCRTLAATGCTTLIDVGDVSDAILSVCCGTPLASFSDSSHGTGGD